MFSLILTLVATLMHGYLSWRIASLGWFDRGQRRRNFWLLSLLIWLGYSAALRLGRGASGGLVATLDQLALDWLGLLFIATTVMLALDLLTGFGLWARPLIGRLRAAALALAALMVVVALVQGNRAPLISRQEVALPSLPAGLDGTRLVVLADLHLGGQLGARWLAARVAEVEALEPDLILLLGDIFEGHGRADAALQPLFARLRAPLGVYAVTGNHEFHGDSAAAIAMSEAAGVEWLRNRVVEPAPGLRLAGVDDLSRQLRDGDNQDRITPLLRPSSEGAIVLLSHSPLQVAEAASAGAQLMLSGHTHNGQIWPFNFLVQRRYPYITGRYQIGAMTLIVSRGTGLWGPRMRLWQPGEIIELTLRTGSP